MIELIFWASLVLIFYCYLFYPLLLFLAVRWCRIPVQKSEFLPALTIVISVHNEAEVIEQKLRNLFSLNYPPEKVRILIGSDASDDDTCQKIREFKGGGRVSLREFHQRRGKMAVLNDLVEHVETDFIAFTDARQDFDADALKHLMANFSDRRVGCVSGELVFRPHKGEESRGIGLYWNYEKFIRSLESQIHSMLGATGAIYAIRRELYVPVPENIVLDDMFIPLKIVEQGWRVVFDDQAWAYDEVARSAAEEFRRKARTLFGNYQIFPLLKGAFHPLKSPVAIQLFSHKLLRVLVPFLMISLFLSNLTLLGKPAYDVVLWLQMVFYGLALAGFLAKKCSCVMVGPVQKCVALPYLFCVMNGAALMGFWRLITRSQPVQWEKARQKGPLLNETES